MVLMPFSIPEHVPLLLDGRKVQTTRRPRKKPLKVGDVLHCYFKPRQKASCRNCITFCQYNYERRQHFGYSCMPTALRPCNIWSNYFGEAKIVEIEHFWKLEHWPDNRDPVHTYYSLLGNRREAHMEQWAKFDGFANLQEAHKWFVASSKNDAWMFDDWDVIAFEPQWVSRGLNILSDGDKCGVREDYDSVLAAGASGKDRKLKPSFYVCGGGGNFNCRHWDDVNGCWQDQDDVLACPFFKDSGDEDEEGCDE